MGLPERRFARLDPLKQQTVRACDRCVTRQSRLEDPQFSGDPDTGGSFTVKRYRSEKTSDDQLWSHTKIVLEPLNPAYAPIELDESAADEVRIIAEVSMSCRAESCFGGGCQG